MTSAPRILLIGCGKMGGALLAGWHRAGMRHIVVVDHHVPAPDQLLKMIDGHAARIADLSPAQVACDVVLLAVKPAHMAETCRDLAQILPAPPLIISVAAGQRTDTIAAPFTPTTPVIRAMPNTPAAVARGITGLIAGTNVTVAHREMAARLFTPVGQIAWLSAEAQMDAVTALSGSGPAYVFLLVEVLAAAGVAQGLAPDLAMILARQTVIGAGALLEAENATDAATLRQNVTSPGGTTAAALDILNKNNALQNLFKAALEAATARAHALSA